MASPRHLWVLVPAAGESRRFADAGYPTPKPFLRIAHKSLADGYPKAMLDHVVDSLPGDVPSLVSLPKRLAMSSKPGEALERTSSMNLEKTRGQADSLRQMVRWLPKRYLDDTAVVIVNCDVVFTDPSHIQWLVTQVDAGFVAATLVVESNSPAMSYAHPYPCPQRFVEKQVLGKHAMAGAWAFASAARLLSALDWACCQGSTEPYLSHAMGRIIGPKISKCIEPTDMLDFGTPKAVKDAGAKIID